MSHLNSKNTTEILCLLLSPYTLKKEVKEILELLESNPKLTNKIIQLANKNMIITSIYYRLKQLSLLDLINPSLYEYMHAMACFMSKRNTSLKRQTEEIINTLEKEDIEVLLLKGSSTLFSDIYPDIGARYMLDIDVLIRSNQIKNAKDSLKKIGYYTPKITREDTNSKTLPHHHLPPIYKEGTEALVELHHSPLSNSYKHLLSSEMAFDSCEKHRYQEKKCKEVLQLSPENQLLHCFIHSELANRNYKSKSLDLRQLEHFILIIHKYHETLDWSLITSTITDTDEQAAFFSLIYKAKKLFNIKIPKKMSIQGRKQKKVYDKTLQTHTENKNILSVYKLVLLNLYDRTFSKAAIRKYYTVESYLDLWKGRLKQALRLSKKYKNIEKIKEQLQISIQKYT